MFFFRIPTRWEKMVIARPSTCIYYILLLLNTHLPYISCAITYSAVCGTSYLANLPYTYLPNLLHLHVQLYYYNSIIPLYLYPVRADRVLRLLYPPNTHYGLTMYILLLLFIVYNGCDRLSGILAPRAHLPLYGRYVSVVARNRIIFQMVHSCFFFFLYFWLVILLILLY